MVQFEKIPLNILDRYMLSRDIQLMPFNSHMCISFSCENFDLPKWEKCIFELIENVPYLRLRIAKDKKIFPPIQREEIKRNIYIFQNASSTTLDNLYQAPFDFKEGLAIRFILHIKSNQQYDFIISVHHLLGDGVSQLIIFNEYFKIYNGKPVSLRLQKLRGISITKPLTQKVGFLLPLKILLFQFISKQLNLTCASFSNLNIPVSDEPYRINVKLIPLQPSFVSYLNQKAKTHHLSFFEALTLQTFHAIHSLIKQGSLESKPIVIGIPKCIRRETKSVGLIGNAFSNIFIFSKPESIMKPSFIAKIKNKFRTHSVEHIAKFIFFGMGELFYKTIRQAKKSFLKSELFESRNLATMLLTGGKYPESYERPLDWNIQSLTARGAMLRSPGVGLIYTEINGSISVTIEYLEGFVKDSIIAKFIDAFQVEYHETSL